MHCWTASGSASAGSSFFRVAADTFDGGLRAGRGSPSMSSFAICLGAAFGPTTGFRFAVAPLIECVMLPRSPSYTHQVRAASLAIIVLGSGCPPPSVHAPGPARDPGVIAPPANLRLPDDAIPLAYDVRLDVDPDRDAFSGHVEIRVRLAAPSDHVWLHHVDLEIADARFRAAGRDGKLLEVATAPPGQLHAYGFGATLTGEVRIAFDYTGHTAREAEGLFREQANGRWYLYSQSESMVARPIL